MAAPAGLVRAQLDTSYQDNPARREPLVGQLVLVGEIVVVGHRQLAAADPPGQGGALLDDQRVRRQVVGPQASAASSEVSQSAIDSPGVP